MPFLLLLVFALLCLQTHWPPAPEGISPETSLGLLAGIVVFSWLSAAVVANLLRQRLAVTDDTDDTYDTLRQLSHWQRYHRYGLLVVYLAVLYLLGGGQAVSRLCFEPTRSADGTLVNQHLAPGFEVYLFLPYLLGLLAGWERFYALDALNYERRHAEKPLSRGHYLALRIRHDLFIIVPPMILTMSHQIGTGLVSDSEAFAPYVPAVGLAATLALLVALPWLLRLFLGLTPLPAGPLRERLDATARRLGFRFSNILVWHTRHRMANAMVTGFVPWARYIILTDRLLDELSPEEIEAVFGHEVGHVEYLHLPTYLFFGVVSILLVAGATAFLQDRFHAAASGELWTDLLATWPQAPGLLELALNFAAIALASVYVVLVFGFLSRHCERQADLYGSRAVSCEAFVQALEKVADINGIPRHRAGNWFFAWQYPTIEQRVDFVRRASDDPHLESRFHASLRLLKWGLLGTLSLAAALFLWLMETDKLWDNVRRWL